jgi:hypothetical protein
VQKNPDGRKAYLLGGMNDITGLDVEVRNKISFAVSLPLEEIPVAALTSSRAFIGNLGFNGCVVSSGDNVILKVGHVEIVFKVEGFLSLTCDREQNLSVLLVHGVRYPEDLHDDGQVATDYWSRFLKVKSQPLADKLYFQIEFVKRKCILYPCSDNILTVADYQRQVQEIAWNIVVPVYIKKGDMLLIQGEQIRDTWYGHVQSVDKVHKTVDVYFYIEGRSTACLVRETQGRHGKNTVPWGSVIAVAKGNWISSSQWQIQ